MSAPSRLDAAAARLDALCAPLEEPQRFGWTVPELVELTGLSASTLHDEINSGRLGCVRIGGGTARRKPWIPRLEWELYCAKRLERARR